MLVRVRERHPLADFFGLERDVDRIFRGAFGFDGEVPPPSTRRFNVSSDADAVTVRAELPGIEPADIAVVVENHILSIGVERKPEPAAGAAEPAEKASQRTTLRAFRLSDDLDGEAVTADCRNGVLTVRIPRRAAAKPRQIEVKTS